MGRWQRTKELDEDADMSQDRRTAQLVYKALIAYLNRSGVRWKLVQARFDFLAIEEPQYQQIVIDGLLQYADTELISDCFDIMMHRNTYTFSDNPLATMEIDIDRSEPLGSFSHYVDYLTRDSFKGLPPITDS